jgi:phosphinothricin acetyltransferase
MNIRPVNIEDAAAVLAIYAPYIERTSFTFETTVPSLEDFKTRISTYTEKYPWLVAEEAGKVIGYAYASKHRDREAYQWSVESSVYVAEDYQGKGVAEKLYTALFSILQASGFVNVYAGITLPNPKSYSFHTRIGFEPVGVYKNIGYKLGSWHDVAWLVKVINVHGKEPVAPGGPHPPTPSPKEREG